MTTKPLSRLVLGLDPGFASFGYAVLALPTGGLAEDPAVVALGTLRTKGTDKKQRVLAADDNIRRARELAVPIRTLIHIGHVGASRDGGPKPVMGGLFDERGIALVCAEKMSFPRSSSAAAKMAMSWGMIVANLERRGVPLLQASPQDVKRRVTGNASASKEEVERAMVKRFGRGLYRMLGKTPKTQHEHAFDALAVVIACLGSEEGLMLRNLG